MSFLGWQGEEDPNLTDASQKLAERRVVAKRALRRILSNPTPVIRVLSSAGLFEEAAAITELSRVFREGGLR